MNITALQNQVIRPILAAAFGHDDINGAVASSVSYTKAETDVSGAHDQTGQMRFRVDSYDIGGHIKIPFACKTAAGHTASSHSFEVNSYILDVGVRGASLSQEQRQMRELMAEALMSHRIAPTATGFELV